MITVVVMMVMMLVAVLVLMLMLMFVLMLVLMFMFMLVLVFGLLLTFYALQRGGKSIAPLESRQDLFAAPPRGW